MTIFFATDIHGADTCFKKFLNAKAFYGADILILGGDITGKAVQLIVRNSGDHYRTTFSQETIDLDSKTALDQFIQRVTDIGLYPYVTDEDELRVLEADRQRADSLFKSLIIARLERWMNILDKKFTASSTPIMICPGNDDEMFVDDVLAASRMIINLSNRVYPLADMTEIVSLGWSNQTPWHTPREASEAQLTTMIGDLMTQVQNPAHSIFNFHVPPINTPLDRCAKLDRDLRVVTHFGNTELFSAGSEAVRHAIEQHQPLLGLFGHVHESRGFMRLGRTLCINPGSNFSEGILNGCLVTVQHGAIQDFHLTTG